jgi:ABC-type sugar transport system ATPase subunit
VRRRAPEPLRAQRVRGRSRDAVECAALPIDEALAFFSERSTLPGWRGEIATKIVKEIRERLQFLVDVGLDYLTLERKAETLSGGEAQRIRLASQIGAGLVGVMYVLDEPSIGLHQRDNERLLGTLTRLRDLGNTVIVVEHDEDAIRLGRSHRRHRPRRGRARRRSDRAGQLRRSLEGAALADRAIPQRRARDPTDSRAPPQTIRSRR